MPLFKITPNEIASIPQTTFADASIKEKTDLQRLLRAAIDIVDKDTIVIAEEFGDWEDSKRRIDLLGLDRDGNVVVFELKRTEDGGFMELQALRYAAMVSTLTFDRAVGIFDSFLKSLGKEDDARSTLLGFLNLDTPDEHFAKRVRIVLVSAEFSRELTTSVLWLNEQGLDIRCIRLRPYRLENHTVLDIQPIIPLPEAAAYQIRLREKAQIEMIAQKQASTRDYTRYTVTSPHGTRSNLPKRRAILEVVNALIRAGTSISAIETIVSDKHRYGASAFRFAEGNLSQSEFIEAIKNSANVGQTFEDRYFLEEDELFRLNGFTYALTNQWGAGTVDVITSLLSAYPGLGISCEPLEETPS